MLGDAGNALTGEREVAANEAVATATILGHWRRLYLVDISKAVHDISAKP